MKRKYIISGCVACMLLMGIMVNQNVRASWVEDSGGRRYETGEGEHEVGFSTIDDALYYFDANGYVQTGKFYVKEKDAYYYANDKGVIQTGKIKAKKTFYIADESGKLQTGFVEYNGMRYYFNEKAELVTGWFKQEEQWYYADSDNGVRTGFIELDGYRYYLGTDGVRVSDAVMEIEGTTYVFNHDGSIDENATTLYPVYQYLAGVHAKHSEEQLLLDSKVQACAVLRASMLTEGFDQMQEGVVETLLKNRGISSEGGYEFSYGGVEEYSVERLLEDMKKDYHLQSIIQDSSFHSVGLGMYQKDNIYYYDIIIL